VSAAIGELPDGNATVVPEPLASQSRFPVARRAQMGEAGAVRGALLLTGATGFVGMELLARYLQRTERKIYVLIRAESAAHARARLIDTLDGVLGSAHEAQTRRVEAVAGDLTRPDLVVDPQQLDALAGEVSEIVHGAASVSFGDELQACREINVEGTRRVLELAERCQAEGGLSRLTYISTAYAAGEFAGRSPEHALGGERRFRNTYEQSKFEAEQLVQAHRTRLPITVARPSIIVGDRHSGWTSAFNVLYWPLRAFSRGLYPILPARRRTPVDVVSVDYVANAVFQLATSHETVGHTYHLAAGEHASCVGELIELAVARFERPGPRLMSPALYRRLIHPQLVRRADLERRRRLKASEAFFPYFAMRGTFDTERSRAVLEPAGITPAPLPSYFDRLVDYALLAGWGRHPVTRAQAMRSVP
jgi:thioester reductase-like protein